ncbi:MAG: DegT/DnrJ/EryC1/StrS family aminotransferase [Acidobacteriota bacterium]
MPPAPTGVPLLDLCRQHATIRAEIEAAVARVFESQRFILGPEVAGLEAECAAFLGAAAVGVASGTDALLLTLRALGLDRAAEVVTTPFTFFATAGAIVNAGARPVFADIDPVTFNLDPDAARAACSKRTAAICAVHLYGQPADMDGLQAVVSNAGAILIEDACQAIGARVGACRVGAVGAAAAFSFFPSKNLGGAGDGGLVTTRDAGLAARIRSLRHHGQVGSYEHEAVGTNSRLDELQAAVLRVKLGHLESWNEARRAHAAALTGRLRAGGLNIREGGALDGADLSVPVEAPGCRHVFNQYTLRAARRDRLADALRASGIGCAVYYPLPLHLQPCFAHLGYQRGDLPVAEQASAEVISLPVFPELSEPELDRVAGAVVAFYR